MLTYFDINRSHLFKVFYFRFFLTKGDFFGICLFAKDKWDYKLTYQGRADKNVENKLGIEPEQGSCQKRFYNYFGILTFNCPHLEDANGSKKLLQEHSGGRLDYRTQRLGMKDSWAPRDNASSQSCFTHNSNFHKAIALPDVVVVWQVVSVYFKFKFRSKGMLT